MNYSYNFLNQDERYFQKEQNNSIRPFTEIQMENIHLKKLLCRNSSESDFMYDLKVSHKKMFAF